MARTLFARGYRGAIVKKIQQSLSQEGHYTGRLDGLYAGGTERAVRLYQAERALALCFDIQVQNGGIGPEAGAAIDDAIAARPPQDERELRILIANAVADFAKPEFREDVRSRKLTIATGNGQVHGEQFELESWGLGEYPWGQG